MIALVLNPYFMLEKNRKREKLEDFFRRQITLMTYILQILLVVNAILSILEKIQG